VRQAVHDQRAGAANAFAAVALERHRFLALAHKIVVDLVEHFEEGHVGRNIFRLDFLEFPLGNFVLLPPQAELEIQLAAHL
jgi:hypothetical protein